MSTQRIFSDHLKVMQLAANELPGLLDQAVQMIWATLGAGGKVLACGNGGSAADAQHFVAELVCRYRSDRKALPALALSADPCTLTAIGNDFGFERIFARQVEALASPGDVLIAFSTSGKSPNVIEAAREAHRCGCKVIVLTGAGRGPLVEHADILILAPSTETARIQEVHGLCVHVIAETIDAAVTSGILT